MGVSLSSARILAPDCPAKGGFCLSPFHSLALGSVKPGVSASFPSPGQCSGGAHSGLVALHRVLPSGELVLWVGCSRAGWSGSGSKPGPRPGHCCGRLQDPVLVGKAQLWAPAASGR